MEQSFIVIHQILERLVGLHRQLLETVRFEKASLIAADLSGIQEATSAKETLIEAIRVQEKLRIEQLALIALASKRPFSTLNYQAVILLSQEKDQKKSEQIRTSSNALLLLIQRIREQSGYNLELIETSLGHIENMKKNILGEASPEAQVYSQQGQKKNGPQGARLLSAEA
jgi:hypothetical protein